MAPKLSVHPPAVYLGGSVLLLETIKYKLGQLIVSTTLSRGVVLSQFAQLNPYLSFALTIHPISFLLSHLNSYSSGAAASFA
ncbi:MAG TPA: hypothetical protein VIQ31_11555 [Phormidium sp.]